MIVATKKDPIHLDLVYERIRAAWGVGRIGARIRDAIDTAIKRAKALNATGTSSTTKTTASLCVTRATVFIAPSSRSHPRRTQNLPLPST